MSAAAAALAVTLAGCGGMLVAPSPTPLPTVSAGPTGTPRPYLPDVDADDYKQVLTDSLKATCSDGNDTDQRMWTCSYRDEVAISFYGPSSQRVSGIRVVTTARNETDRRSWIRGYGSIVGTEVWQWAESHFGSNDAAWVGDLWVQMAHDATSDGVMISTKQLGP